jgi:alanyl-tRNA synthetase
MHVMCGGVIDLMSDAFPELQTARTTIEKISLNEETLFRRTLERGLGLLEDEFARMARGGEKTVPGRKLFELYDTYGFPADLTAVIAAERGLGVDQKGFEEEQKKAKEASGDFAAADNADVAVYKELAANQAATTFLGYETTRAQGKVVRLAAAGKRAERAKQGDKVAFITDQTPFYGAAGGQVGDTGTARAGDALVRVTGAEKVGDVTIHLGVVERGALAVGDTLELAVEDALRDATRANHSATHLLHLALKQVLGSHAVQKGSLVAPDRLRFDFTHTAPMTDEEKRRVEDLVNDEIRRNADSRTEVLAIEEAKQRGAVSMFGEKYGDKVRVVRIGNDSLEFCGGTHVRRAGDIGMFKILGEQGIAQGVRRIEAATGAGALEYVRKLEAELARAAERLKGGPFEVAARVEKLEASARAKDKEIAELKKKAAGGGGRDLMSDVKDVGGVKVLAAKVEGADGKTLRVVGDELRDKLGSGILVLAGVGDGKVALLAMVTKDLVERFHAGKIVGVAAEVVGGKGGGRPDMAQAGGTDPSKVDEALRKVHEYLKS